MSRSNTLTEEFVNRGLSHWGVADAVAELTAATNLSASPLEASLLTDAVSGVLDAYPETTIGFYTSAADATATQVQSPAIGACSPV